MLDLIGRAHAQLSNGNFSALNPLTGGNFVGTAVTLVNWVLLLAGILAVIYLIYGGIMYITAGGDADKATKGRTAVINAIIGIIIILLAVVIVTWVRNVVNGLGTSA